MRGTCTLLVCAAPLARRAPHVAAALRAGGWDVATVLTPNANDWVDHDAITLAAGSPPLINFRDQTCGPSPRAADLALICPITFNTVAKAAVGIADTYAHSLIAEYLGRGTPIVAIPMVNPSLWGHPVWREHTRHLTNAGVVFLDPHTGRPDLVPVQSGTGDHVADTLDPSWLTTAATTATSLTLGPS